MKDENLSILMEGLAADVATILKKLNSQTVKPENPESSNAVSEIKLLRTDVQNLQACFDLIHTNHKPLEQQRLIDLKVQLDRITLKLHKEDNFFRYYFSPPIILLTTLAIITCSILAGALADRYYINYKQNHLLNPLENATIRSN